MTILFAPAVALVGLLVYLMASNPKAVEIGRLMFFAGMLVTAFVFANTKELHFP